MPSIGRLDSSSNSSEYENDSETGDDCELAAVDEFVGYQPPHGIGHVTDRTRADITPQQFFEEYIRLRRPAVISGSLADSNWRGHLWTNSYLKTKAGDAEVLVEDRKGLTGEEYMPFGQAPKISMKYDDFVSAVISGETRYYLTTQDLERFVDDYDEFGLPKCVYVEPLLHLGEDFPLQPAILGNLIPHQISLWQGSTGKGQSTSTGLHHDFHDNLYILLRGRKRFRLFPPSDAPLLNLVGQPTKIHPNGLIVHRSLQGRGVDGQGRQGGRQEVVGVRADGVPFSLIVRHKQFVAEQDLAEAEKRLELLQSAGQQSSKEEIVEAQTVVAECEEQLEAALDEQLRYGDDCSDEDSAGSYSESDEECGPVAKKSKVETVAKPPDVQTVPSHFCNVHLPTLDTVDPQMLFKDMQPSVDNVRCLVVNLHAGEMLYLPASWFHEVTSYNEEKDELENDMAAATATDCAGHLALNYWMYPPDNDQFQQPYVDHFWSQRWTQIQQQKYTSMAL